MTPNELRVGNLFHKILRHTNIHLPDTSTVFEVVAVPFGHIQAVRLGEIPAQVEKWDEINFYDASPMTLNEEWVLKLGGVKHDEDTYGLKIGNTQCWFLKVNVPTPHFVFVIPFDQSFSTSYVHRVQNIVHALTGEELKIQQ